MNIDRDDVAERQARLDWMINEFREAQARHRAVAPKTPRPHETIDTTAVTAISSSDPRNLSRLDDSTR